MSFTVLLAFFHRVERHHARTATIYELLTFFLDFIIIVLRNSRITGPGVGNKRAPGTRDTVRFFIALEEAQTNKTC
jgi:hypothetical protein